MLKRLWIICLIIVSLTIYACNPETGATAESQATNEPIDAPVSGDQELVILAAASLTEAFTEMGNAFEQSHPGVVVVLSFAGSQRLAQQLVQGASADVFASANMRQMQAVVGAGRVTGDTISEFARNELIVVVPEDNPGLIHSLADLTRPGLKIVLAAEEVPAGEYTIEFFAMAAGSGNYGSDFQARVLNNVVSYEDNVRSVLTKVNLGEADAGIVYTSDAVSVDGISTIAIPAEINIPAFYPIAPVSDSNSPALAAAFVAYVLSVPGQEVLNKYGFLPVD